MNYSFSSTDFTYENPNTVDAYTDGSPTTSDISTLEFNPPSDNSVVIASSSSSFQYHSLYYADIRIADDFSEYVFTVSAQMTADSYAGSNTLSRTVYVNVRPHITDYFFAETGTENVITQAEGGGVGIFDLVLRVKDYNGCTNIDDGTVVADLSALGLSASESLTYASCAGDGLTATFKKSAISTSASEGTKTFNNDDFTATDEDANVDTPSDGNTDFDDEDRTTDLNFSIVAASAPTVSLISVSDSIIGGATNTESVLSFSGSQDGDVRVSL